jgi:flagellar hook assembly protein FlgD
MPLSSKIALLLSLALSAFTTSTSDAQQLNPLTSTPGTLTFTVKTITNNSTYSPKNILAIWIKDSNGNFVVSRKVMANKRIQHLVKWNASSLGVTTSATTGATLSSHGLHTVTWDGKNAAGIDMADGIYQVWVEYSSTNSAINNTPGPSMYVEFQKGTSAQHITPADGTYFQNSVADWVPLTAANSDLSKAGTHLEIYPNPFAGETTLKLKCDKPSQVYISAFDASGKKVAELVSDSFNSGTRYYTWDGTSDSGQKLKNGLYFIHIQINGLSEIRKVIIGK